MMPRPAAGKPRTSLLTRRHVLRRSPLVVAGTLALLGTGCGPGSELVEVDTAQGRLRGRREGGVVAFKGVPYAGGVSGEQRFKAPPPLTPWRGVRDALEFGPHCFQPQTAIMHLPTPMDENCLVLNVWTPAVKGTQRRPVMVYLHGGGFSIGSGEEVDGTALAHHQDVVVVSVNHRLGILGYLYLGDLGGEEYATSGNQGTYDLIAALQWIHDNIEAFGGDPQRVMIFGESGGGAKVATLYASAPARGRFHRASIQSAPAAKLVTREEAAQATLYCLDKLGIRPDQFRKLEEVPAARLMDVQRSGGESTNIGPVVDGRCVTQHPFYPNASPVGADIPLLVGNNRDEATLFLQMANDRTAFSLSRTALLERLDKQYPGRAQRLLQVYEGSRPHASPTDLYVAITTANMVWNAMDVIAERKAEQQRAPTFKYLFAYPSARKIPGTRYARGAMHSLELNFEFDNVGHLESPLDMTEEPASREGMQRRLETARNMSELWAGFAREGVPHGAHQPAWPPFTAEQRATMIIDAQCRVVADPYREERLVWLEKGSPPRDGS